MRKRGKHFTRRVDPLAAFRSAGRQHPLDASQKVHLDDSPAYKIGGLAASVDDCAGAIRERSNATKLTGRGTGQND